MNSNQPIILVNEDAELWRLESLSMSEEDRSFVRTMNLWKKAILGLGARPNMGYYPAKKEPGTSPGTPGDKGESKDKCLP